MSPLPWKSLRRNMTGLLLAMVAGCGAPEPESDGPGLPDPSTFVPVTGVVTLDGKPVGTAVVTFLPRSGMPGVAETDADGKYSLEMLSKTGIPPGEYKVAVSYLVSAEGQPQGLGPRGAMSQPPGMLTAKEVIEAEYSDLGRTKLRATVGPKPVTFDWAVTRKADAPKEAPKATSKPAAKDAPAKSTSESKPTESKETPKDAPATKPDAASKPDAAAKKAGAP